MKKIFSFPKALKKVPNHYCPGCGHGLVHRLVAEVIDELNIREKIVAVAPVGCAVIAYDYWDFDCSEAAHGRALAVATGIKRVQPDKIVFTYQGDGDLAAIGIAETLYAANRGENLTTIFINNAVYGMTGGQMAPTTVLNQKTTTTPLGRGNNSEGSPLKVSEILASLDGVCFVERNAVCSPAQVLRTKKAIKKAFENQLSGKGFSFVEVLSMCPICWGKSAEDSVKWVEEEMVKSFPLGRIKG